MNDEPNVKWKYSIGQPVTFKPFVNLNPEVGFELDGWVTNQIVDGGEPVYTVRTKTAIFNLVHEEDIQEV